MGCETNSGFLNAMKWKLSKHVLTFELSYLTFGLQYDVLIRLENKVLIVNCLISMSMQYCWL